MLDLIYISHLQQGKQKSLAYALGLAKAFAAPLSLLPSTYLGEMDKGAMSIWRPSRPKHDLPTSRESIFRRSRKEKFSLYLLGKSSQPAKSNYQSYQIIQRLVGLGFPILWIPFDFPFQRIKNILITNNGPGLTDHKLKQLLAANFLPRVFQIENNLLSRIHWNNISHIRNDAANKLDFSCPNLEAELQRNEIDLTVYPINHQLTTVHWQGISSANYPLLFLPLSSRKITAPEKAAYLTV